MKLVKYLAVLMILALSMFGASCSGGGGTDAAEACEDFCDRVDDCFDDFPKGECDAECDDIDDDDDIDGDCDDAIKDLFQCAEDLTCDTFVELDSLEDLFFLEECADEVGDVFDECDIEGP